MELGVRDWMIIVGVLLILAVLLDGIRRVRNERRGKIRFSLNKQFLNSEAAEEELPNSELPNGGARPVMRAHTGSFGRRGAVPGEAGELDLDQSVPLLMESVASANLAGALAMDDDAPEAGDLFSAAFHGGNATTGEDDDGDEYPDAQAGVEREAIDPEDEEEAVLRPTAATYDTAPKAAARPPHQTETPREPLSRYRGEQEIIVINVVSREEPFDGADLLHILLACDLRYGKMNIFHRHEQANGRGQVQFSVANSVEPGTFNLDAINNFTTPGVCFFMSVPGPEEPLKAFECMVETAQCVVRNLGGELLDESRSAMTAQTLEHCRQRLQEFERRQLAQA